MPRSIKAKLLTLCLILSSITAAVGLVGYGSLKEVTYNDFHVIDVNFPNTRLISDMFLNFRRVRITLRTLGLPGITQEQAESAISEAQQEIEQYEAMDKKYQAIPFVEGEKEVYEKVQQTWGEFKKIAAKVIALHRSGKPEDRDAMIQIFFNECPQMAKVYTAAIKDLYAFHDKETKNWVEQSRRATATANMLFLSMVIIGFAVALSIGYWFANSITRSINTISTTLAQRADKVASAAQQIAESGHHLSASTAEQAAALQETSASVDETRSMIDRNAENATKSANFSMKNQEAAMRGKQAVEDMIGSIADISDSNAAIMQQIEDSNRSIAEIVKVIAEIGNKTKVINDIVFQTKLLSFNASVEAARAGEHGKGFAVVAEEVGNLAQMSGNSAKEISQMLDTSIKKVEEIVADTRSKVEHFITMGKGKVQTGTLMAQRCGEVLDEIVRTVGDVNALVGEISSATQEQSQGVQEIAKAMSQLDESGQINRTASEQALTFADDLRDSVAELHHIIAQLEAIIHGEKAVGMTKVTEAISHRNQVIPLVPPARQGLRIKKAS